MCIVSQIAVKYKFVLIRYVWYTRTHKSIVIYKISPEEKPQVFIDLTYIYVNIKPLCHSYPDTTTEEVQNG